MVWHWSTLPVFACCCIDEPIRYILMQRHLFSGKWICPVTREGKAALVGWKPKKKKKKRCFVLDRLLNSY